MIPRAVVTALPDGTTKPIRVTADSDGVYTFPGLMRWVYSITASASNLSTFEPVRVELTESSQTLDLKLKLTATQQQLTVREDSGPAVSTDASANASAVVIKGADLEALADNPDDLAADLQALAGPSAGPSGGSIYIDGFSGGEIPPKDSIREIRINQNPFSPEFDKLGYGRIEIFTKPGSDKYHGTIDYNLGTDRWNSRNPYAATKAPLLLNEFEGGGGGPLGKRASFTLDGQRNMVDNGFVVNAVTLDPQTFAIQPFSTVYKTPQRFTRLSPRLDYALSEKNTLSMRYSWTQASIDGAGISGFDLPSRGYRIQYTHELVQLTETSVIGAAINETRFQYYRDANHSTAFNDAPEIQVLGSFNSGGSSLGKSSFDQNDFELQNVTSIAKSAHFLRFGVRLRGSLYGDYSPVNFNGTFTFGGGQDGLTSIDRYRETLLHTAVPTQFSISTGTAAASVNQVDAGLFVGDEWKLRPNVTLSLGLRYELQTNTSDRRDWAPRVAVAWSPQPKTVVRAGFGTFYDRFALANTLTAERFDGVVRQQYVVTNPDFYPNIPSIAALAGAKSIQTIDRIAPGLRAPRFLQTVVSVERALPGHTTLSLTYTNAHGAHLLRSRDASAANTNPVFLIESPGRYNQNQLALNLNSKLNAKVSLFGFYVLNRAKSDTDGVGTFVANPLSNQGEYGPAATDVHNRFTLGGTILTRGGIRLSPFLILQSGPPFDITAGRDLYGTTLFNGRPGIATASTPGAIATQYGYLDPNAAAGEALLPRNYGRGPGQESVNLRVAKLVSLGRVKLTVSMSMRNLLNHTNPGPIIGDLTSPLFGRANRIAGQPNGEGFSENASNRRLEMQIRFNF